MPFSTVTFLESDRHLYNADTIIANHSGEFRESSGRIIRVLQAVAGKNKIPDVQEMRLTDEAEFLVNDVVKRTNNFFATKWKDYQTAVETSQIKLFKEVKPVE